MKISGEHSVELPKTNGKTWNYQLNRFPGLEIDSKCRYFDKCYICLFYYYFAHSD